MRPKYIILNGLAAALCTISFIFFRGASNIFNAYFITMIFYIITMKYSFKEAIFAYCFFFIYCFIFFNIQIFFVLSYIFISAVMIFNERVNLKKNTSIIILSAAISVIFVAVVLMTDMVFGTQINLVLKKITGENPVRYVIMFIIEGLLISNALYFSADKLRKKLKIR